MTSSSYQKARYGRIKVASTANWAFTPNKNSPISLAIAPSVQLLDRITELNNMRFLNEIPPWDWKVAVTHGLIANRVHLRATSTY